MRKMIGKILLCMLALASSPLIGLEKPKNPIPQNAIDVSLESNTFAVQFFQQLPKEGNVCFSPFSISSAFSMVYAGAKGETANEMSKVFHFPKSVEDNSKGWSWVNNFFTFYPSNSSDDIRLRVANSLWVQTNFPVLPSFREVMSKYFSGTFRFVDFKSGIEAARSTINAWVKQNTFGKITEILSSQSIDSSTRMVLVSALYLKAKWLHQFDTHLTSQQPFFNQDGFTETTLSMTQTANFPYLVAAEASILEMPYILSRSGGPEFSMVIALPHQREGIADLEKEFTVDKFQQWMKDLNNTKMIVTIPKFKIIQLNHLNEELEKMGLQTALNNEADFSGMSGIKSLKIGNVLHKVYLSVDETGSEAAAATAVSMTLTSVFDPNPPVIFQADHPFLYFIYEKKTGMILFMGRVSDPNKE